MHLWMWEKQKSGTAFLSGFWISAHTESFDLSCRTAFLAVFQWARFQSKAGFRNFSKLCSSPVDWYPLGRFFPPHCICQILSFCTTLKSTGSLSSFAQGCPGTSAISNTRYTKSAGMHSTNNNWKQSNPQGTWILHAKSWRSEFQINSASNTASFLQLKVRFGRIYVIGCDLQYFKWSFPLHPAVVPVVGDGLSVLTQTHTLVECLYKQTNSFSATSPSPVFLCWKHSSGAHKYLACPTDQMTKGHKLNGLLMRRSMVTQRREHGKPAIGEQKWVSPTSSE